MFIGPVFSSATDNLDQWVQFLTGLENASVSVDCVGPDCRTCSYSRMKPAPCMRALTQSDVLV